jgi:hypothetical protein
MIYRKRGTVVRWEHGVIVRVRESGEAREIGAEFIAEPCPSVMLSREASPEERERRGEGEGSRDVQSEILRFAQDDVGSLPTNVERLVITEGKAQHECGDHRWSDTTRRVHLSLVHQHHRALIDLAGFDLGEIKPIAEALARIRGEREVTRLRLAPNVAAALLPSLIGMIDIEQMPADHDGYGEPIAQCRVTDRPPPNAYRPSYRIRPVRAWHNLRALPFGTIGDAPRAIALLAPPHDRTLRLLCVDGDEAFATEVTVAGCGSRVAGDGSRETRNPQPATAPARTITAVGESETWYPYAAGAFGAEMML